MTEKGQLQQDEVRPALREAVKRLMDASRKDKVEVVVRRRDLELLLAVWETKKAPPKSPSLHPEQR